LRQNRLRIFPAVIVSGGSGLGTVDYHYPEGTGKKASRMQPQESFCLAAVSTAPSALMLSFGPGNELFAEQEIERLCVNGSSLGEALAADFISAILTAGPSPKKSPMDKDNWKEKDSVPAVSRAFGRFVMGDPDLKPFPRALGLAPFTVKCKTVPEGVSISCASRKPGDFSETRNPFASEGKNDRLFFSVVLPSGAGKTFSGFEIVDVQVGKRFPKVSRATAGLEAWSEERRIHVLVVLDALGGGSCFSGNAPLRAKFLLKK
jgi:hypothetical protein